MLLESSYARSVIAKGMYIFCPELMLEGDDSAVFSLFTESFRILGTCGELTSDDCSAAMEEFSSFAVEKRRYHAASEQSASGIVNIV